MNNKIIVGIRKIILLPIYLYRVLISPALKPRCRYFPSCSEYFELAVMKYGVARGSLKGIYRILRCNPFAGGGYDPP
jgi:putative membrane protein insertion efficiency factor